MHKITGTVAQIADLLGLDTEEIAARQRFLEFGADDIARLKQVHPLIEDQRDEFAAAFYAHLLKFPPLQHLLADEATLARLKRTQAAYFSSLTEGDYGADYVADRLRVGIAHQRIGLEPKWYIGAYREYLSQLLPLVWQAYDGEREPFIASFNALLKIVMFDMGLALDTYFAADKRAILQLNEELEQRVAERTAQLAAANQELEAFSYSVSHDLRAPLRSIDGFSQAVLEDCGPQLDEAGKGHLQRVRAATQHMAQLIDDMLKLSRVTRSEMNFTTVDLSALAQTIASELQQAQASSDAQPGRRVEFTIAPGLTARGDARLLEAALENLLNNAWKFTSRRELAHIEFGAIRHDNEQAYFVRDDGAGFDMAYAGKLFTAFQRLHAASEFPGTGVGLATVQRIIHRHGGRVWAEGEVGKGATFYFTLP